MAKVTRIKAQDSPESSEHSEKRDEEAVITRKEIKIKDKKEEKAARKSLKKKSENSGRKPFILIRPFVYLGRYLRDSWRELRQVRWPNRKATWKMVLAVLVYTAIFVLVISLLDLFFTWLFGHIIK